MPTCKRCDYEWRTRTDAVPKACPNCRSRSWDTPAGKKGRYCPECPHCNPTATPEPVPTRKPLTQAELDATPENCCCRGAHRPDNPNCEANL